MEIIDNYHFENLDRINLMIKSMDLKDVGFYSVYYKTRSLVYNDFKKYTICEIIEEYKISYDDAKKLFNDYYISHNEYVYNTNKNFDC